MTTELPEPDAPHGPLQGLRVIELAGLGPAPFAGMLLADLGADVVRVDRPQSRDQPPADGSHILQRGKRSTCLDLKEATDRATLHQLASTADVLIESGRPGVAERLGVGPQDIHAVNERLVYARMTGWGQSGPKAHNAGHDVGYLARTGLLHAIGSKESPQIPLALVGDFGGGALYLVIGILAAVHESQFSGQGQVIDAAVVDGAVHMATLVYGMLGSGTWRDRRQANLMDGGSPFYAVYETADHEHIAVGPVERKFYDQFLALLDPDGAFPARSDRAAWPDLRQAIATRFRTRTRDEWTDVFAGTDACVEPVLSLTEAMNDSHLCARETFVSREGIRQPAPAPRFSRTPGQIGSTTLPGSVDIQQVITRWSEAKKSVL